MNRDLIIKRMKRVAHDISDLANDINNNKHRVHFFSDIIKQKIFELYDLNQFLTEDADGADLGHGHEANVTPAPRGIEPTISKERFLKTHQTNDSSSEKNISEEKNHFTNISESDRVATPEVIPKTDPIDINPPTPEVVIRETPPLPPPPPENPIITSPQIEDKGPVLETSTNPPPTDDSIALNSNPLPPKEENNPINAFAPSSTPSGQYILKTLLDNYVDSRNQLNDITQRLQNAPISNFSTAISIGQKHEFINGLFGGNAEKYKMALQQIENKASVDQALEWLEREFLHQYHWDRKEKLTTSFLFLIRRRFL
jgi:hypothetical protein